MSGKPIDDLWDALWEDLRHNASGRPSGLLIITKHRYAIEAEAIAAERERIAAAIGRTLTDARIEEWMRQQAIPLYGHGISVDLQARGVAASVRAAALAIVEEP